MYVTCISSYPYVPVAISCMPPAYLSTCMFRWPYHVCHHYIYLPVCPGGHNMYVTSISNYLYVQVAISCTVTFTYGYLYVQVAISCTVTFTYGYLYVQVAISCTVTFISGYLYVQGVGWPAWSHWCDCHRSRCHCPPSWKQKIEKRFNSESWNLKKK
jgi:hypothetical protein